MCWQVLTWLETNARAVAQRFKASDPTFVEYTQRWETCIRMYIQHGDMRVHTHCCAYVTCVHAVDCIEPNILCSLAVYAYVTRVSSSLVEYDTNVDTDTLRKRRIHFYVPLVLIGPKLSIETGVSVHSFCVTPSGGCAPVSGVVHMLTSHLPESEMWVYVNM